MYGRTAAGLFEVVVGLDELGVSCGSCNLRLLHDLIRLLDLLALPVSLPRFLASTMCGLDFAHAGAVAGWILFLFVSICSGRDLSSPCEANLLCHFHRRR